jgi:hypothetical protein
MISPQYIAGFFDGEGYVYHGKRKSSSKIVFTQKDPTILRHILEAFPEGLIAPVHSAYTLTYNGNKAFSICLAMLPHLIGKHLEVEMLLLNHEVYLESNKEFLASYITTRAR